MNTNKQLEHLAKTFPALSEENKQYILGVVDALAYVSDQKNAPVDQPEKDTGKAAV